MDELATFNRERWNALVEAGVAYSRPLLDLTPEAALAQLNDNACPVLGLNGVRGKRVLCLASGGGQQSVAFALLGADVTVIDLSDAQLEQDRKAAAHYGFAVRIEQGDMRDLSRFDMGEFDVVWQGYSINFVADPRVVFTQVVRVLRPGGHYLVQFSNPQRDSLKDEIWREGYALVNLYRDGEFQYEDPNWEFTREDGSVVRLVGPREFNHTWSTIVNGLAEQGFAILRLQEWMKRETPDVPVEIGSWAHCTQVLPPYISVWCKYVGKDGL